MPNDKIKNDLINNDAIFEKDKEKTEKEKSPSFIKYEEKIDKNIFINDEQLKETGYKEEKSIISIDNESNPRNNKIIKMHNINQLSLKNNFKNKYIIIKRLKKYYIIKYQILLLYLKI